MKILVLMEWCSLSPVMKTVLLPLHTLCKLLILIVPYLSIFDGCRLNGREVKCPSCNDMLNNERIYPDNFAKREIQALEARCVYARLGCEEVSSLKAILVSKDLSILSAFLVYYKMVGNIKLTTCAEV